MTVEQKQCLLKYLGYYNGKVDGEWGGLSENATREFQSAFGGLDPDGIIGTETAKALKHAVAYDMFKKEEVKEPVKEGDFWDGIKHFKRKEFKCKCGNVYCNGYPAEPQEKLVKVADRVREHFNASATVSSGLRCKQHNANVGGVSNSRHLSGKAMDFCIAGKTAAQVLAYVQKQPEIRYSYAIDNRFVHMDIQ
jgi:hypothetical protein